MPQATPHDRGRTYGLPRLATLTSASALLALTLAGCGGTSATSTTPEPGTGNNPSASTASTSHQDGLPSTPSDPASITRVAQISLPLDAYLSSPQDIQRYYDTEAALIRQCVQTYGISSSYQAAQYVGPGTYDHRYGVINMAEASRYGYHLPPIPGGDTDDKSNAWNPSPLEAVIVKGASHIADYGVSSVPTDNQGQKLPDNGCSGEVDTQLQKGVAANDDAEVMNDEYQLFHKAAADPRVLAATRQWSTCMKKQGYNYTSPADANEKEGLSLNSTPREIGIAVIDVRCKANTDYAGIFYAVEVAYQKQFIEAHAQDLAQVTADHDRLNRNVAAAAASFH